MSNDLALIRCQKQFLIGTAPTSALQVVEWLGAIQAQDFGGALWAIGQRSEGLTAEDVHQALAERQIVRTWPLRGTIHFVPATDLRWMLALTGKRQNERSWSVLRSMGLDLPILEQGRKVLESALRDGPLTRPEIYARFEYDGIATAKGAGLHVLSYWAQEGLICFGPHRAKQPTFVLLDDWLSAVDSRVLDRDVALETLAIRYFQSHGPATDRDFAWWSGLTLTEARGAMRLAERSLEAQVTGDTTLWSTTDATPSVQPSGDMLRLLSPFDELLVAYKDRTAYDRVSGVPDDAVTFFHPSVLLNGRLIGSWQKTLGRKSGVVHLQFGSDVTPVEPASVAAQLARLSHFHGVPVLRTA